MTKRCYRLHKAFVILNQEQIGKYLLFLPSKEHKEFLICHIIGRGILWEKEPRVSRGSRGACLRLKVNVEGPL